MTSQAWFLLITFVIVLLVLSWPLGKMIDAVMNGRFRWGKIVEKPIYRLLGIDPETETGWLSYCIGHSVPFSIAMFSGIPAIQSPEHAQYIR